VTGVSALLIFVGLFFAGGAFSFWKQKLPKSVTLVLGIAALLALAAGALRLEVWK
jgi:ABC-type uncharacterized transport system permease subunit